jgi:hypothetical protein
LLTHVYFYFAFTILHFFASFAPFAPYQPLFCVLKASLLCFIRSFCSLSTSILHSQSFIYLLHLFPLLHVHLHFASTKLHFSGLFASFILFPLSICILEALFLYFGCLLMSTYFAFVKLHCFASFVPFVPFVPCPPPFCILKALFLCFICSLCSMSTFILHPQSFICLLHLLSAHLHFASTKFHFSGLFSSFVFFPPSICILKALFLCFGCLFCSLRTFILHSRSFISLLNFFPLLSADFYFVSSKLYFSVSFTLFAPCPPVFCILEATYVCFICFLCSMSTFILHPQSFIFLLWLLNLVLAHLYFCILKALFLYFGCLFFSLPTSILHPYSFISLLWLLTYSLSLPICVREVSFLYFILFILFSFHLQFASSKLYFSVLIAYFSPCVPLICIRETSLFCFICSFCSLHISILHSQSFIALLHLFPLLYVHLHFASSK